MKKQRFTVALALLLLTGCARAGSGRSASPPPESEPSAAALTPSPTVTGEDQGPAPEELFAQLPGEFLFASGAGAWSTVLSIQPDGSFTGEYHDADMGGTPPVLYYCAFSGTLSQPERVDAYTYSTTLLSLEQEEEEGMEYMGEDGVRYIISTPYGMEGAGELLIYRPGMPVSELPEEFCGWTGLGGTAAPETLPFWGLYNVNTQQGWIGYEGDSDETKDLH